MEAELTRLTHKIVIQVNLVSESCTICSSRSRRPVRKLLDMPSYANTVLWIYLTQKQNGSGAHPASYPMGTRGSFPGGKAVGAWSWPFTSI